MIRVGKEVREYLRELINTGTAHHIIVVHGDCAEKLKTAAQLMRIQTVEL